MNVGVLRRIGPQSATVDVRGRVKRIGSRFVDSGTSATIFAIAVNIRAMPAVHQAVSTRCKPSGVNALVSSGVPFRFKLIVLIK